MRIDWDSLFMEIVRLYARRSVCKHFQVGVAFSRDNRILCAGYNGPPKGELHCNCSESGCAKEDVFGNRLPTGSGLCRGAHAEMNALANANLEGVILKGATVYCTYSPCYDCSKVLVNLGIKRFVFNKWYKDGNEHDRAMALFKNQGIVVMKYDDEKKEGVVV